MAATATKKRTQKPIADSIGQQWVMIFCKFRSQCTDCLGILELGRQAMWNLDTKEVFHTMCSPPEVRTRLMHGTSSENRGVEGF